jgi:hypothetical protein
MLFTSPEFIYVFLPAAVIINFTVARWSPNGAAIATTAASLIFYAWWSLAGHRCRRMACGLRLRGAALFLPTWRSD